jgi:hypothetical protein
VVKKLHLATRSNGRIGPTRVRDLEQATSEDENVEAFRTEAAGTTWRTRHANKMRNVVT